MTKANLFNLVGRHSMAHDMVNSIVRPDQLANSHGAILSLANVDRYATFMAGAKQACRVKYATRQVRSQCDVDTGILFARAIHFYQSPPVWRVHWSGEHDLTQMALGDSRDRQKQAKTARKAWLYLCFLCYLLFNFCSHLCASAPRHELPSARFRDLLTQSAVFGVRFPTGVVLRQLWKRDAR